MEIVKKHENAVCSYVLYMDTDGTEIWHCRFKDLEHPVNKLFRMSGAEKAE